MISLKQKFQKYKMYAIVIFFVVSVVSSYFKGRHDASLEIKNKQYKDQLGQYKRVFDNSLKSYDEASKKQKIDFENALKESEQRQLKRIESLQRNQELRSSLYLNQEIKKCVLDDQTFNILNKSLKNEQ